MSKDVIAVKTVSNEEVVATIVSEEDDHYILEKPRALVMQQAPDGSVSLGMLPFMASANNPEFTTEDYLFDTLNIISAKSQMPIKNRLSYSNTGEVDSIACSRDDTNYSFFARVKKDKISIIIKQLGEETMEFELSREKAKEIFPIMTF